jgi:hypothetical protein
MRKKANPVADLIGCFGGIRPMQAALGEKYPNVIQNWQAAGRIPHYRKNQICAAIQERRIAVDAEIIARLFPEQRAA